MTLCVFSASSVCDACGRPARHAGVRRECRTQRAAPATQTTVNTPAGKPGTELKRLLAGWPFRITASSDCSCNAMANTMDAIGPEGCDARLDEIVAHLRTQAERRGLPFLDAVGRMLVRRAIANARRNA